MAFEIHIRSKTAREKVIKQTLFEWLFAGSLPRVRCGRQGKIPSHREAAIWRGLKSKSMSLGVSVLLPASEAREGWKSASN